MADRLHIGLKSFEISSKTFNLSLSITSTAFIYHVPLHNIEQHNINTLIQSKQLWLLPRGLCRLDVYVHPPGRDVPGKEPIDFLDFIADTICQSSLWSQLGLSISVLDVQYSPEGSDIPSLYFSIEQPDMSSALLSPPHTYTAQFKGLECVLRFNTLNDSEASAGAQEQVDLESPLSAGRIIPFVEVPISSFTFHSRDLSRQWENAAYLVEAALNITLGVRQRIPGLSILELKAAPSLLSLAPAIWNSHYLKCAVSHTKNFAVISNILASSVNGQSPELRRKVARLSDDGQSEAGSGCNRGTSHSAKQLESCIERRLWDLLQATLKPTMRVHRNMRNAIAPRVNFNHQSCEIDEVMVNQGAAFQHDSAYENPENHRDENLSLPSGPAYDDYLANVNYYSNLEFFRQHGDDDITFPESELYEVFEGDDGMYLSYPETGLQLPQPHNSQYEDWSCNYSDAVI